MSPQIQEQVTTLLEGIRGGRETAKNDLFKLVYGELREIAGQFMHREGARRDLQPTELVHEAALRLLGNLENMENRRHFFQSAVMAMRRVLVDAARKRGASKRNEGRARKFLSSLGENAPVWDDMPVFIELDDALGLLEKSSPRLAEVFQLSYYGGLSTEEIAKMVDVAPRTAQAYLQASRTWLYDKLCADA